MMQAATELKGNPFGALGMAIGEKIVEGMVDAFRASSISFWGMYGLGLRVGLFPERQHVLVFHWAAFFCEQNIF
jgi:hypothetical protein